MIKYVFFDFNGTILDDVDLCLNLLNKMLKNQNKKELNIDEYKDVFQFPVKKYYELAGIDFNIESFESLSLKFIQDYQDASYNCNLYPNLLEVLEELDKRGIKKVVLSASQIDNLTKQLEHFKIYDKFDKVLGLSNIYANSKIEVARNFIKDNNILPNEVLSIGDTTHDYEVSKELGFNIILFSKGHQSRKVLESKGVPVVDDLMGLLEFI